MGKRQDFFKRNIYDKYKNHKHEKISIHELEQSNLFETVSKVYKQLGGQLNSIPIRYGSWDISSPNFIIELDEERHFNKYRFETLSSDFYLNYSNFSVDNYKFFCREQELSCLSAAKWGKNWKNNSTEKMFIPSNVDGDLAGSGSSRWRQRAYYDFLKDVTSIIKSIPVIRVSIYDKYEEWTINEILTTQNKKLLDDFIRELQRKTLGLIAS